MASTSSLRNILEVESKQLERLAEEDDTLPPEHQSVLAKMRRLYSCNDEIQSLKQCWKNLSDSDHVLFREKYGRIVDLLYIPVQWNALRAAVEFWDPAYRCFTFSQFDLTPTMEEYQQLLQCPVCITKGVYFFSQTNATKDLKFVAGIDPNESKGKLQEKGTTKGWYWNYIEEKFKSYTGIENTTHRLSCLALGIYGLVIFPSARNLIDVRVLSIFVQVFLAKVNPVPAILAETFISLNFCRQKGQGTLLACSQLLYVWLMSHIKIWDHQRNPLQKTYIQRSTLVKFLEGEWETRTKTEWIEFMKRLDNLYWVAVWLDSVPVIVKCGNLSWVPLSGIRGCVGYSPALVIRQFGMRCFIPKTKGLSEAFFTFKDQCMSMKRDMDMVKTAWDKVYILSRNRSQLQPRVEYEEWQSNKGRVCKVPPQIPRSEAVSFSGESSSKRARTEPLLDYEDPRREIERLRVENTRKEEENRELQRAQQSAIQELEGRAKKAETELNRVREELNLSETKIHAMREQIKSLKFQMAQYHDRISQQDQLLIKRYWALKQQRQDISGLRNQVDRLVQRRKREAGGERETMGRMA